MSHNLIQISILEMEKHQLESNLDKAIKAHSDEMSSIKKLHE
jgi:hypothetical protein